MGLDIIAPAKYHGNIHCDSASIDLDSLSHYGRQRRAECWVYDDGDSCHGSSHYSVEFGTEDTNSEQIIISQHHQFNIRGYCLKCPSLISRAIQVCHIVSPNKMP